MSATDRDELLTVDELSARADVPIRTIRFYASRRLLPPPHLRGRTGLYDHAHLARLELIRGLQAHGYTLAAVEAFLQRLAPDASPEDVALYQTLIAPWAPDDSEDVEGRLRAELAARLGPEVLASATEIVERHTFELAAELAELYRAQVLRPYFERGRPQREREELTEATAALKSITTQAVVAAFQRAVDRIIRDRLERPSRRSTKK